MSQPYVYSDYPQHQYYYSDSYDSANNMHTPIQHTQSHNSAYDYQTEYPDNTGVTPSAHTVNDSSVLTQTYSYPNANYATNTTSEVFSSYDSAPNYVASHHPDSGNQLPHQGVPQYGGVAPGQSWTGPAQYTEVTTVHPGDLHDQRRGSCISMSTDGDWHGHDTTDEQYDCAQPAHVEQNHQSDQYRYQHQSQQYMDMNFGMYSPTQHPRIQELAHNAPCDTNQWVATSPVPQDTLEPPYGTLPIHDSKVQHERRSSDAYQGFDNGPIGNQPVHASPSIQSQHPPSTNSPLSPDSSPQQNTQTKGRPRDLFVQQRKAASYQQGLQVQQELKYQLSGHLERFEAAHQRQEESFTTDQDYGYTGTHDAHHHNHAAHHHRQHSSSSDHSRLATAPVVPSQAHERPLPFVQPSPEIERKEVPLPQKKPALACLFCRKRKIACGPPPPDSVDRTCNQCSRRKQPCEYPTESRRGIRKPPREPAPEEPMHQFVHGDAPQHEGGGPIRRPPRRKRND